MGIESRIETAFALAVRRAGGQSAFARLIKRPQQTVHDRLKSGAALWPEDVLLVERELKVSRHDLRPDLYPREQPPPANDPAPADRYNGAQA